MRAGRIPDVAGSPRRSSPKSPMSEWKRSDPFARGRCMSLCPRRWRHGDRVLSVAPQHRSPERLRILRERCQRCCTTSTIRLRSGCARLVPGAHALSASRRGVGGRSRIARIHRIADVALRMYAARAAQSSKDREPGRLAVTTDDNVPRSGDRRPPQGRRDAADAILGHRAQRGWLPAAAAAALALDQTPSPEPGDRCAQGCVQRSSPRSKPTLTTRATRSRNARESGSISGSDPDNSLRQDSMRQRGHTPP